MINVGADIIRPFLQGRALRVLTCRNKLKRPYVGEPALGLPTMMLRLLREGEGALPYTLTAKKA